MKYVFCFILIGLLPINVFAASSAMDTCRSHMQELKTSMDQRIQLKVVPEMSNFLIKLYQDAGLTLTSTDIDFKNISEGLMGVSLDLDVKHDSAPGTYNGNLWNAFDQTIKIRQATDNAVWDSLGNLVTPATEVTCVAERSFRQDMGIFNSKTGKSVGWLNAPADETVSYTSYFLVNQKFLIKLP